MTEEQIKEYINKRIPKVTPKVVYHIWSPTANPWTYVYIRYRNEKGEHKTPMIYKNWDIIESDLDVLIENYESR